MAVRIALSILAALLLLNPSAAAAQNGPEALVIEVPPTVLTGVPFGVTATVPEALGGAEWIATDATGAEIGRGILEAGEFEISGLSVDSGDALPLALAVGGQNYPVDPGSLPGWVSLVPPLLAIAFALIFREVVISLFAGIWLGALFIAGMNPITATMATLDNFILGSFANDSSRVSIAMFSLLLGGMVGVITRSGGTSGIVEALRPYATNRRRGQIMVWLAGLVIFFDDYANTLIVGNTMRPVTDRLRVSREKLAYIVDSTAAPLASIAVISTWVGFEISLIGSSLQSAAAQATDPSLQADLLAAAANPFNIFVETIPFRFYPILALIFVLMIAVTQRDFGPMLTAERRAASGGGVLRPGSTPVSDPTSEVPEMVDDGVHRWYNAMVPLLAVVLVALAGIVYTGMAELGPGDHAAWDIVGAADPFRSLLWASFSGCFVAILMAVVEKVLTVGGAIEAWMGGMRAMLLAIVILVLAWALGGVTESLGTGSYLADLLGSSLSPRLLPVLVFLVAAAMSFATGTSWGTMAILFPVVVPLAVAMEPTAGIPEPEFYAILLSSISSIMAGSIFGDHCSPISDTTVLSSMASSCDHIDHVRTQLPYALAAAVVGMGVGDIPTAWGMSPWISLVLGTGILYGVLRFLGQRDEDEPIPDALESRESVAA